MPSRLLPFLRMLAWSVLALGLGAGILYAEAAGGAEYRLLARVAASIGGLAIGCLLGRLMRLLARWQPAIPVSGDTARPEESLAARWLRGFAAGFWLLVLLSAAATLGYSLLIRIAVIGSLVLPATLPILLLLMLALCGVVPLAAARGMIGAGEGLPRWTLAAAAGAGCFGGIGLFIASLFLIAWFRPGGLDLIDAAAGGLGLAAVLAAAVGTPALVRNLRPVRRDRIGSLLPALMAPAGAWLLYVCLDDWLTPLGPNAPFLWLLPGCLLWGGSMGALLAMRAARRRARLSPAGDPGFGLAGLLALIAAALGLLCLGTSPLGGWMLFLLQRGPVPRTPVSYGPPPPPPTQPGTLRLPGPVLVSPAAGATLSGPVWRFAWRPPRGASPGDLYQFTLWPPGAALPAVEVTVPFPRLNISSHMPLLPPANRAGPGMLTAVMPKSGWPPGPWTWRVRVWQPGRGIGRWSEARPFTPSWK